MSRLPRWIAPAVGVAAVLFGPGLCHQVRLAVTQHRLDRQLSDLAAQKVELIREQQRLTTDPAYVEGLIRSTFKVAQKGELVVTLSDAEQGPQSR